MWGLSSGVSHAHSWRYALMIRLMHYCNWTSGFNHRHTLTLPFSTFSETAWHAKRLGRNSLPEVLHWTWFLQVSTSFSAVACVYLQLAIPNGGIWSPLTRVVSLVNVFYLYHLDLFFLFVPSLSEKHMGNFRTSENKTLCARGCGNNLPLLLGRSLPQVNSFRSVAVKSNGVPCSLRCPALTIFLDVRKCAVRACCAAASRSAAGAASLSWEGTVNCRTVFALERITGGGKLGY